MAYNVGDTIIHPAHGGCIIQTISHIDVGGNSEECYTLQLLNDVKMTVFVPLRSSDAIGLRNVISPKNAQDIIHSIPDMKTEWIKVNNIRKQVFTRILKSGNLMELANMIKTLICQTRCKPLSANDQHLYNDGVKKLVSELSLSLKRDYENMENCILGAMQ